MKVIIDSEQEHIMRYYDKEYTQPKFEVFIRANYTIGDLEFLCKFLLKECKIASKEIPRMRAENQSTRSEESG